MINKKFLKKSYLDISEMFINYMLMSRSVFNSISENRNKQGNSNTSYLLLKIAQLTRK